MLRLKIAPNDPQSMSQDGEAILRSLQNKSMSIIDLMVRESLQNSLDAALEGAETTKVEFNINDFSSEKLAPYFENIDQNLLDKFPGKQTVLVVSDKNTTGLTGDYKSDSQEVLNKSNFHKLVFGIGKNQEREGAGGSWGLGKTSYFRMGIGLIIYYTRISTSDGGYEERLIASLIESPKHDDRLLPKSERGIAWWGNLDHTGKKIFPITDKKEISDIFQIFGIVNYEGKETGTRIIIPYLRKFELDMEDECIETYPWEFDREESIKMAIQRWYSPRIWNDKYVEVTGNSQLDCSVNGDTIHRMLGMEPIFKCFQKLYTSALLGEAQSSNIIVREIRLPRNAMENSNNPVGYIAFSEVGREALRMTPPDNKPSGLAYLGIKDSKKIDQNISKVVAYARKPGMVVEYSLDGKWSPSGLIQKEDHLLLAFFVPNSNGLLVDKFKKLGYSNLESYLRAAENADHANWIDEDGIGIIRRIKSYSEKAIQEAFQDLSSTEHTSATSALSRKFGSMLMPPKNFGRTSAKKKSEDKVSRKVDSRNRLSDITVIDSIPIDASNVKVVFKAFIKGHSKSVVFIQVLTQEQQMNSNKWLKAMGNKMKFPFSIENIFISRIDGREINQDITDYNSHEIEFKLKSEIFEINSKIPLELEIEGIMYLKVYSNQYLPNVVIRSVAKKDEGEENDSNN